VPSWALAEILFYTAERKIADVIGTGPTHIDDIAAKVGANPLALQRLLNALAAQGIFRRVDAAHFGPTPLSDPLRSDTADSQRAYIALGRLLMHDGWSALHRTMETGRPALELQFGLSAFDYMHRNPQLAAAFAEGMTSTTRRAEHALVSDDLFGDFETVVDVGGSHGSLVRLLLAQRPSARGIVFDRPEIAAQAARRWAEDADANRLSAIGGSFFESVPTGGDLYLLKQILHDWTDEQCIKILRNVRKALPPHGRIVIVEMVLPDDSSPHPGWMYDMLMMTMTGGRERTAREYQTLLEQAGLRTVRVTRTASPMSLVEARAA
jgi:hypothetical protein